MLLQMPLYIAHNGYKNPHDPDNGVFQYAKGCKEDMFQYYQFHPVEGESFNQVMDGVMANQVGWPEIYPHKNLMDSAAETDTPFVVHVRGSIGHDMKKIRQR